MKKNPAQEFLQAEAKRFYQMLLLLRMEEELFLSNTETSDIQNRRDEIKAELDRNRMPMDFVPDEMLKRAGLSEVDIDAYYLRLVVDEVPWFDRRCAMVMDNGYPDRSMRSFLEDLLCTYHGPIVAQLFNENSPLLSLGLLSITNERSERVPGQKHIAVNKVLADFLLQREHPQRYIRLAPAEAETSTPYLEPEKLSRIEKRITAVGFPDGFLIHGPEGSGRRRLARYLAGSRGRPVLEVSMPELMREPNPTRELRDCIFAANFLDVTLIMSTMGVEEKDIEPVIRVALNSELGRSGFHFILASDLEFKMPTQMANITTLKLKAPDTQIRERMWREITADYELDASILVSELARMFHFSGESIREAMREADGNLAPDEKISRGELLKICRQKSVSRLSELAFLVEPKFGWNDLVLAPAAMHLVREIEADIRADARIFDEWYMDRVATAAKGHNILFTGLPGTGKTMAASIIAREIGVELYKIDLSRVSSKYVGDIEKNLAALFNEAEKANAALFFDEADSLFGKRGDNQNAQGHYINQQIGYLLQRLESFNGIAFMATNLEKNIDKAFERRFNFVVPFTFPETDERIRIWQRSFSSETPIAEDVDFQMLGTEFEATGANIKSIALKATRRAAADEIRERMEVTRLDIIYATVREFDKIVKGWDLDYKGSFRQDIDRVRLLLKGGPISDSDA